MKKGGINALEVVTDHVTSLKQRLQATPDPHEKELLRKRIRNLESVLDFLAAGYSGNPAVKAAPPSGDGLRHSRLRDLHRGPPAPSDAVATA